MYSIKRFILFFPLLFCSTTFFAQTVYDKEGNINKLFTNGKTQYIIRFEHFFNDTLYIPQGCELKFEGGKLSGPIVFNNTTLSGQVNLKGASIKGKIRNKTFDASWLCAMDGETDDAASINEMIEVCGHIFFPKGTYRLISLFNPVGLIGKRYIRAVNSHIGIHRSDVILEGEAGTQFMTTDTMTTLCLYSKPNRIEKSIGNIEIKNIKFTVKNDGKHFYEFRHTIKTIGVNGLTIENCTFDDFLGDAICLSHYGDGPNTGERSRNQNVKILNNKIIGGKHHNTRNGISIINGKNVIVKGNTIKSTTRKDMPGAIDIEPNNSAFSMENIRVENNYIEDVYGRGIAVFTRKASPAHHIEILSNEIKNCLKCGIAVSIRTNNTADSIIIKNNHVHGDTDPYLFRGNGKAKDWIISDNSFERSIPQSIPGDIKVKNLIVRNNRKK